MSERADSGVGPGLIRLARPDEIGWINERYINDARFVPSDLSRELVAIAEVDGERAGLGRLVRWSADEAELGGMFVLERFRGRGLAEAIVSFLMEHARPYRRVYCLPFEHLAAFYSKFGFKPLDEPCSAPAELLKKHVWCNQEHADRRTLLFVRE